MSIRSTSISIKSPILCLLLKTLLFLLCIYIKRVTAASIPSSEPSLAIEKVGLFMNEPITLDSNDMTVDVLCPVAQAVQIKDQFRAQFTEADLALHQSHLQSIQNNITVAYWLKDGRILHRYNGNAIIRQLQTNPNALVVLQVTDSDEGLYTCFMNYSGVTEYHEFANHYLKLYPSIEFPVQVISDSNSDPDVSPIITHPPSNRTVTRGQNVTLTCNHLQTMLSQDVYWFRSNCSVNELESYDSCRKNFSKSYENTTRTRDRIYLKEYTIEDQDGDTLTIANFDDDDADLYGCLVENTHGIDVRIAELTLDHMHFDDIRSNVLPTTDMAPLATRFSWFDYGLAIMLIGAVLLGSLIACIGIGWFSCCTHRGKKFIAKNAKKALIPSMVVEDHQKDGSARQHLPKVNCPDIYNMSKSDDGYICGHYNQKSGHLLAQSICNRDLIKDKNFSISSNNSHSDEASSWGKSMSPTGDHSRAFYIHTSNDTTTTVPLYDHPPSTGTTQICGALVQDSCVINPTYGFIPSDFDATISKCFFSRRNLEPQEMIGQGQFGEVWRYIARQKDGSESFVAVKKLTVKSGQEEEGKMDMMNEIDIMKRVNEHPNVIKFLNICVEPTKVLLIMEYAENGTLQSYLRSCRRRKDCNINTITSKELLKYSYHVAKGMEYIVSKGIIHRDLASRNILLAKDKVCKIADFGLARFVGESGIYQRLDKNTPVPIKWMAPESLSEHGIYSSKSDVFSVGVLMWEVVTLGATPYDFLPSSEVLKRVVNGERLPRPDHCKEEFYNIMYGCWHQDPSQRPTFKELADELEMLLQSENDYIQLDKYPEHAYYNILNIAEKEMVSSLPLYPELDNVFDQI